MVDKLEGLVALWSKVIEQVLAESEQVGYRLSVACTCNLTSHFDNACCTRLWIKPDLAWPGPTVYIAAAQDTFPSQCFLI